MDAPSFYDPASPQEQPVPLPSAGIRRINDFLSVQPPLSRRGHGPGVLLFLSPPKETTQGSHSLDPEPVQKWAEEGFAVAYIQSQLDTTTVQQVLEEADEAFRGLGELVDIEGKFGVIVYDESVIQEVLGAVSTHPHFLCTIAHGSNLSRAATSKPALVHIPHSSGDQSIGSDVLVSKHSYPAKTAGFILPTSPDYDPGSAALAHSRSLVFLRKHLGGPIFDIEAVWDEHCYFEFEVRSVAQTMGTMVAEPYVNHIPTMTGGVGRENLTRFYRDHFIFSNPADARLQVISRTVGPDRVVDEFIYHITHDRVVDWLLPGVPPTGKKLEIPMMAVVNIRGDRLYNEHIWWDQATVLLQCGVLPSHVPYPSPEGNRTATLRLPVAGIESAHMLADGSKGKSNEMLGNGWGLIPEEVIS